MLTYDQLRNLGDVISSISRIHRRILMKLVAITDSHFQGHELRAQGHGQSIPR